MHPRAHEWASQLEWMRAGGVTEAEWDSNGGLICAKLGAVPSGEEPVRNQGDNESPAARARRILLGATGSLHQRAQDGEG